MSRRMVLVRLHERNRDPWAWNAVPWLDEGCEHGETACVECLESWRFDHEVAGPARVPGISHDAADLLRAAIVELWGLLGQEHDDVSAEVAVLASELTRQATT